MLAIVFAIWLGVAAAAEQAPDFTLRDLDGRSVQLSDHRGKVVVLSFWATWCVPCQAEMKTLQDMYTRLADRGLVVLSISVDDARTAAQVSSVIKRNRYTFPVLLDGEGTVVTLYDPPKTVPFTAVIARDGSIAGTHSGYNPGDEKKLEADVMALLGAKE